MRSVAEQVRYPERIWPGYRDQQHGGQSPHAPAPPPAAYSGYPPPVVSSGYPPHGGYGGGAPPLHTLQDTVAAEHSVPASDDWLTGYAPLQHSRGRSPHIPAPPAVYDGRAPSRPVDSQLSADRRITRAEARATGYPAEQGCNEWTPPPATPDLSTANTSAQTSAASSPAYASTRERVHPALASEGLEMRPPAPGRRPAGHNRPRPERAPRAPPRIPMAGPYPDLAGCGDRVIICGLAPSPPGSRPPSMRSVDLSSPQDS